MIYIQSGILFSHKNELRIEICYKMDNQIIQKITIVSEIRHAQKDKYCMTLLA